MKMLMVLVSAALLIGLAVTSAPAEAADRAEIERMQKALKQQGHDPGPIDGVMGNQTRDALRAYQKKQGLEATGQLDEATTAKLGADGGDAKPNAVDPAQATKTGANVGEGASYSRSTEKGKSTMRGGEAKK
jgi:peptidoglycan hydrolase-like protein with peptidoglycan-binding domain